MRQLTLDDLENLSIGTSILGSGGEGDSSYFIFIAKHLIEKHGPITIISVDDLKEDDFVVPVSIIGAPLIHMERLLSGRELDTLFYTIETTLENTPTVVMPTKIGGSSFFTSILAAATWGLPLLDADLTGRSFPQLQMNSCYLKNLKATPAIMVDCLSNTIVIEASNAEKLEEIARSVTVAMGSCSAISFCFMDKTEAQTTVIPGTITQALKLGKAIRTARQDGKNPILECMKMTEATLLAKGMLIDIDHGIKNGFLQGSVTIESSDEKITLFYQNTYLLAKKGKRSIAATPDILVLMDETTGKPITSEALRYGLQVVLLGIPGPKIWQTPEGLELVGPHVFGYDIDYSTALHLVRKG